MPVVLADQRQDRDLDRRERGWRRSTVRSPLGDDLLVVGVDEERERRRGRRRPRARSRAGRSARRPGRRTRASCPSARCAASGRSRRGSRSPRAPTSRSGTGTRCRSCRSSSASSSSASCSRTRRWLSRRPSVEVPAAAARRSSTRYHCSASSGGTKNSISICSNSRVRKRKLPGVISLRNDLPICAIPNGGLRRASCEHVLEVDEDALRRLRAQVGASSPRPAPARSSSRTSG